MVTLNEMWTGIKNIASEIERLEPWGRFDEENIIYTIFNDKNYVFFSIFDEGKANKGVRIFFGSEAFLNYRRLKNSDEGKREFENIDIDCKINCATLKFDKKSIVLYKNCGGLEPCEIKENEEGYIKPCFYALNNLLMMLSNVIKNNVNIEKEQELLSHFEKNKRAWVCSIKKSDEFRKGSLFVFEKNNKLVDIKKIEAKDYVLEVEAKYMDILVEDSAIGKYYPYVLSGTNGEFCEKEILKPKSDKILALGNMLIRVIDKKGKPKEIKVVSEELRVLLEDLCTFIGVKLVVENTMAITDEAREKIYKELKGEKEVYVISVSLGTGYYRHIKIAGSELLSDLSIAILNAFDIKKGKEYAFFTNNKLWSEKGIYSAQVKAKKEYANNIKLKDRLEKGQSFKFVYDFDNEMSFQCKVLRVVEECLDKTQVIKRVGEGKKK